MAGDASGMISQWAGGGAQTTLGAAQMAYGLYKAKHNKRPTYEIPQEAQQNLNLAKQQAMEGLPEEQKQAYLDNLNRSAGYSLSNMTSRRGGLAGLGQIDQQMNQGYGNLLAMDSQARQQNIGRVFEQNQNMANYRDQAFQFNKVNPYYETLAESQALQGAGMQNIGSGFNSGAGASMNYGGGASNGSTGKQFSTQNPNSMTGMQNYNPNSQNGSLYNDYNMKSFGGYG
jgi:hypothetical protein